METSLLIKPGLLNAHRLLAVLYNERDPAKAAAHQRVIFDFRSAPASTNASQRRGLTQRRFTASGIRNVSSLRLDRQLDVDRALFLAQRAAQLRQRDVLQLANPLARHAKLLADFLERLRLATIEPEALEDYFFFG